MVEYFLKKDVEMRQQARRKARLEAQAKVSICEFVVVKVEEMLEDFGVNFAHC